MLQIWMCRTKPDVPLKSKMIQNKPSSAAKIVHLDSIPHFTMFFGVNFRESLRVWPLLRGQNLKCTSRSLDKTTQIWYAQQQQDYQKIWICKYVQYGYVYRIYTSCKHVRVCVVDIHVVHCFYEVRKYKYHSGRVICPNFMSRGMNLEKEKNMWSISLSMTWPHISIQKKTPKKLILAQLCNWQCKKLNRFCNINQKSKESVTIMSDLKPFQCFLGDVFNLVDPKKTLPPQSWVARTFRCFHPLQEQRRKIFRHKVWNFKGPQVPRSSSRG